MRVNAREVSYARVCLALRPFRLFAPGDLYVHVRTGHDVDVPVLVQRAERGRPPTSDDEHVWLPPLEHWCAVIAAQVRMEAYRDLARWKLEERVVRSIGDECRNYSTASVAEVAARVYAKGAGVEVPPVTRTMPRVPAADWRR